MLAPPALPSFRELVRTFAYVGAASFGGPAAQIALMHRIVVDEKKWLGEARYLHALNFCMLLPGPEAQQLATYVGWLAHGVKGGIAAGLLFVLPGAIVMGVLSALYAAYAELPLVQGVFYGVKCAVLAIVVQALVRIAGRALKTTPLRLIALAAFLALFLFALPFPLVVIGAGVVGFVLSRVEPGWIAGGAAHAAASGSAEGSIDAAIEDGRIVHTRAAPRRFWATAALWIAIWLAPVAALLAAFGPDDVFARLGVFFAQMAVVTFGGAYAVLAYVAQEAVQNYGWLDAKEMLHGLALAETTPGPLVLVLQFVGFLAGYGAETGLPPMLAGLLASLLVLWVTFVPSFLWIFAGAPYAETLRGKPALAAALAAITAAVVGVILNLAIWFALHVVVREVGRFEALGISVAWPNLASVDWIAAALVALALLAVLRFKAGVLPLLGAFAAVGVALQTSSAI